MNYVGKISLSKTSKSTKKCWKGKVEVHKLSSKYSLIQVQLLSSNLHSSLRVCHFCWRIQKDAEHFRQSKCLDHEADFQIPGQRHFSF